MLGWSRVVAFGCGRRFTGFSRVYVLTCLPNRRPSFLAVVVVTPSHSGRLSMLRPPAPLFFVVAVAMVVVVVGVIVGVAVSGVGGVVRVVSVVHVVLIVFAVRMRRHNKKNYQQVLNKTLRYTFRGIPRYVGGHNVVD